MLVRIIKSEQLTVSLVMGMKVANNFTHSREWEIIGVNCEDAPLVHIIYSRMSKSNNYIARMVSVIPMSVHIVSKGIPAERYLEITFATSI